MTFFGNVGPPPLDQSAAAAVPTAVPTAVAAATAGDEVKAGEPGRPVRPGAIVATKRLSQLQTQHSGGEAGSPTTPMTPNSAANWDPSKPNYCSTCSKDFRSGEALKKHKKYSSLHKLNKEKAVAEGQPVEEDEDVDEKVEFRDVIPLFDGTKLFWRTNDRVDVQVFEDEPDNILLIVVYNPETDVEYPMVFMDLRRMDESLDWNQIEVENKRRLSAQEKLTQAKSGPRRSQQLKVKEVR
jgi:hypothetical protein